MQETLLTVQDHSLGGQVLHQLFLTFQSRRISVAEVIERRVRQEVADYNRAAADGRDALVVPTARERQLNGVRVRPTVDADRQVAAAWAAFEQNAFFVLADNRQLEHLDDTVYWHEGLVVSFIKLTPLVGG